MDLLLPLLPILVFVSWGLLRFGLFLWRNRGRGGWSDADGGSILLPPPLRQWWIEEIAPVVGWLAGKGVRPDHISIAGAVVSATAAVLLAFGHFVWGGYAMMVGGGCDMLDGRVARAARIQSRRGAYLDSALDRYSDMFVLIGLAVAYRASWVALVALLGLVGTVMVSYARARAEGLGVSCRGGLMQRPERLVVLAFAAILDPVVSYVVNHTVYDFQGGVLLPLALVLVTVLSHGTAFARIRTVYRELRAQDVPESSPAKESRARGTPADPRPTEAPRDAERSTG